MSKVIAIDFDGTLCVNRYPEIGPPKWRTIERALAEQAAGATLVLWTCREGELLQAAIDACTKWGLQFDEINANPKELIDQWGTDPRKLGAAEFWDDRAVPLTAVWLPTGSDPRKGRCSNCRGRSFRSFKYCPDCGALMGPAAPKRRRT